MDDQIRIIRIVRRLRIEVAPSNSSGFADPDAGVGQDDDVVAEHLSVAVDRGRDAFALFKPGRERSQ